MRRRSSSRTPRADQDDELPVFDVQVEGVDGGGVRARIDLRGVIEADVSQPVSSFGFAGPGHLLLQRARRLPRWSPERGRAREKRRRRWQRDRPVHGDRGADLAHPLLDRAHEPAVARLQEPSAEGELHRLPTQIEAFERHAREGDDLGGEAVHDLGGDGVVGSGGEHDGGSSSRRRIGIVPR